MLTVLTWAAISVTAISILIVTLKSGLKGINQNTQTSSNKQMLAALIVVVGALILRPAFEGATSITANKPDLSGIFFLKESLVMSIGYYHLYIILVNIIASMRSR